MKQGYINFIEDNFTIIDKELQEIPFKLNAIQGAYAKKASNKDVILKARQQGFSSFILARFAVDFLVKKNSRSVVVADETENAMELLERVKHYISSYEYINKIKVPLKYNSKNELHNEANNAKYTIGTAKNTEFGRSKTVTNLHMSEAAFYPNFERLLAGALQAVIPDGYVVIETTANGFNRFKTYWDDSKADNTGFQPLFFPAKDFYNVDFLLQKEKELKRHYAQEYPDTAEEAFLTSGLCYFNMESLKEYLDQTKKPIKENTVYV